MIGDATVTRGLVGPRIVGGVWSSVGNWTLPAFTAGGTITRLQTNYETKLSSSFETKRAYAGDGGIFFQIRKARGDIASPANVSNNDTLGTFQWGGYHTDGYDTAAQILVAVDGTPGNSDMPGRIVFKVSPDGSATPVEAMRISQDKTTKLFGDLDVGGNFIQQFEISAPGAGAANTARVYAVVGGDTLTDYSVVFQDGTIVIIAEEVTPLDSPILTQPSGVTVIRKMIKLHPGLIQFVEVFPDGKTFVTNTIEYHDAEKIAANKGCEGLLPADWEVTTLQQRVDKQVAILDKKIKSIGDSLPGLDKEYKENLVKLANKRLDKEERAYSEERQETIPQTKKTLNQEKAMLKVKRQTELARLK